MANYKWPQVYTEIKDLSGVLATNSVTSCAYVGEAEFGPINKPTLLSTLKNYTTTFGSLNSAKYGYAGYSLAVAAESIDSHYFVRVVKAGTSGAHSEDDAMYASTTFPAKGKVSEESKGWYVEEIANVINKEDSSALFSKSYYELISAVIADKGSGYKINDTLTATFDTTEKAEFVVTEVESEYVLSAVETTPVAAGLGYVVGDTLKVGGLEDHEGYVTVDSLVSEYKVVSEGTSLASGGEGYPDAATVAYVQLSGENAYFNITVEEGAIASIALDPQNAGLSSEILTTPQELKIAGEAQPSTYATVNLNFANTGKIAAFAPTPAAAGLFASVLENPVTLTEGTGTGAKANVTFANTGKIKALSITKAGRSTTGEVTNPIALENGTGTTGTGAKINATLTNLDKNNALIFVANNPNNLTFSARLTDSTVNENKAYSFTKISYVILAGAENTYTATVEGVNTAIIADLKAGDSIEISRVSVAAQAGIYEVVSADKTTNKVTYLYKSVVTPTELTMGKISIYPEPKQRTFQVEILQTAGRITSVLETYQFCTLYQAKDNYGNSTFIEDVINGYSDYVTVYVNPNLLAALEDDEVLEPSLVAGTRTLVGGKSGGKPSTADLCAGWELFRDRTQTAVSLLMNSGYTNASETSYQNKMLEIAEARRDCFCLFDIPVSQVEADDAIDWRKNVLGTNSYRAALSSPWVKTYDSIQGRANFAMCPSAFMAKLIGSAGDPWHAPAGPNRGILSSSTVSPTGLTQAYDNVTGGILYADNQINCMIKDASAGYVNWGQRTLQQKPSALDRINVARTVIYIETVLRDAARWHLFENNTPYERMQISLQFSSFLDTILSANGIAGYKVICDSSNNTPIVIANNQLVIDIILQPVYAAESIIMTTTVTGADASVDVTSSAN